MNLYKLHTDPSQLKGSDVIPAAFIINLIPERESTLTDTGEIIDDDMIDIMKGMTRNKKVEDYLLNGSHTSNLILKYAVWVIGGRWPEGEKQLIDTGGGYYLRMYALAVIRGRWPEAEDIMKKYPETAYYYASDILEKRWPEAEPYIRKDPQVWDEYKDLWEPDGVTWN